MTLRTHILCALLSALLSALGPRTALAQTLASSPPLHGELDPYMPRGQSLSVVSPGVGRISWQYPSNPRFNLAVPEVVMDSRKAEYMGFVEGEGTYIENRQNGGIYVVNYPAHTLIRKYGSFAEIPLATLSAMHSSTVDYALPKNQREYPPVTDRQNTREPDPNLPQVGMMMSDPLRWQTGNGIDVQVISHRYLGFNDEGSWVVGDKSKHVAVWNLKSRSYTIRYHGIGDIPRNLLLSLRNAHVDDLLGKKPPPAPKSPPVKRTSSEADRGSAGLQGADAAALRNALAPMQAAAAGRGSNQAPGSDPARLSGTSGAVSAGILTFTRPDGARASFNVVRARTGGAPTSGSAGAWIATSEKMLFNVLPDGAVSGQRVPDALLQAWLPRT